VLDCMERIRPGFLVHNFSPQSCHLNKIPELLGTLVPGWPRIGDDFTDHDSDEFELRGAVKVRFTSPISSIPH